MVHICVRSRQVGFLSLARHSEVTSGGVGLDAVRLLQIISEAGQEYLSLWPFEETLKQLVGSVAIAIQRGNVMTFLAGHSRALAAEVRKEDDVRGG
jgi:hypothetical protein